MQFRIDLDVKQATFAASGVIDRTVFPLVHQALKAIAHMTAERWIRSVNEARLWSEEKKEYVESIKWTMVDDFNAVVKSDYRYAQEIEEGRPARDLKRMLDTSDKVRTSKKGKRYLIIPFRHNAPGGDAHAPSMPADVYAQAKELKASRVTGMGTRLSGHGAFDPKTRQRISVSQRNYSWGEKLVGDAIGKRHQGMYRFNTSTPGGGRSSSYLTFRVMVEGSPKWIIPAKPGLHLVRQVVAEMQPLAQKAIDESFRRSASSPAP